jgi:hypothetical protein
MLDSKHKVTTDLGPANPRCCVGSSISIIAITFNAACPPSRPLYPFISIRQSQSPDPDTPFQMVKTPPLSLTTPKFHTIRPCPRIVIPHNRSIRLDRRGHRKTQSLEIQAGPSACKGEWRWRGGDGWKGREEGEVGYGSWRGENQISTFEVVRSRWGDRGRRRSTRCQESRWIDKVGSTTTMSTTQLLITSRLPGIRPRSSSHRIRHYSTHAPHPSDPQPRRRITVLAIESSADDTCASIVNSDREILSSIVISQNEMNAKYGGIHPLEAQHRHAANLVS